MLIIALCIYIFVLWFIVCVWKKNYSNLLTYIAFGVYLPLFFYQLGWSSLIDSRPNKMFDYIFIVLTIIFSAYALKTYNIKPNIIANGSTISVTRFGKQVAIILNLGFFGLYFIENYLGSGTFIPGLRNIDIHTYSAPIISYITSAPFLVMGFDYLYWRATKKKVYIFFILLSIIIPVVTRLSRMAMVMSVAQLLSLIIYIEMSSREKKRIDSKKKRRFIVLGALAGAGAIGLMVFTGYRMSVNGAQYTYADAVGYTGPEAFEWMSVYYGYFPMSFNNLKINLYRTVQHNYIGLYSFLSFYFGILQFDNLLGISVTGQWKGQYVTSGSAAVPTAYWDYYYDFGILFWIPVLVAVIISYYFLKKSQKEETKLSFRTLYFWYIPYWFFSSFQNTLFLSNSIVVAILMYFIIEKSFRVIYPQDLKPKTLDMTNDTNGV